MSNQNIMTHSIIKHSHTLPGNCLGEINHASMENFSYTTQIERHYFYELEHKRCYINDEDDLIGK